jgi:uncharacterized protein (DUF305 family)
MTASPGNLAACLALAVLACGSASRGYAQADARPANLTPAARAAADSGRPPFNEADVRFMQGMIHHHAQAVLMAGWAPTHGASVSVRAMCERIVVGQRDEIGLMQRWLRERRLDVPDGVAMYMPDMPGMDHGAMMPGMLTQAQLVELDRARGQEFDRLFLRGMIMHHQGALTMVNALFDAPGSTIDDLMYKFASDISADQSTEIERMQRMLAALPGGSQ